MMELRKRHGRFLLALAAGLVAAALAGVLHLPRAAIALVAADVVFAIYLVLMVSLARHTSPRDMRRHAADRDEGLPVILCIAIAAIGISLTAIVSVLRDPGGWQVAALAFVAAPLGWTVVHVLMAQHYAHAYYTPDVGGADVGGMNFPGTDVPSLADFWYFSFGIGMTAQVSDVTLSTPALRRWVLGHAVGSFFYNTVILALAVNAGVALAGLH
jgi:uncharacterized membrane protein